MTFFFQAEDGIRDRTVTGVQTCALPILMREAEAPERKMKRSLSALDLTALGIGAIIGSGIFALTGTAAAGERVETVVSRRSEERRVGKECRSRWGGDGRRKKQRRYARRG